MKQMNRKITYTLIVAISLAIVSIWYVPRHTWRAISWDGYSDSQRGVGMTTWGLINGGAVVGESIATYSSSEDAREDFRKGLSDSGAIIESTRGADDGIGDEERVVKVYGPAGTKEGAAQIIRLKGKVIQTINAGGLEYALAFERDWLKMNY
jgi:hypothetical protein